MIEKTLVIKNKMGLHARPASTLVNLASRFKSRVKVLKGDQEVDGKSIMGLMTLAACSGTELHFIIDGEDENSAISAFEQLFENGFGEE